MNNWVVTYDALAGYYAHCSALDACAGDLLRTVEEAGIADDTIFIFTSDHGDAVGCHGHGNKQAPWDESIMVPFLLRYPARFGRAPRTLDCLLGAPDIMPTLLGLSGLSIPRPRRRAGLLPPPGGRRRPLGRRGADRQLSTYRGSGGAAKAAGNTAGCAPNGTPMSARWTGRGCSSTTSPIRIR